MSDKKRSKLAVAILTAIVVAAFFTATAFAGIATSPLGLKGATPFAGLGSCPLGTHTSSVPYLSR